MLGTLKTNSLKKQNGFTLIELMIVVAIIGILASVAIGAYQTYTIRAQVSEGMMMAGNAKTPVVDAFLNNGEAPLDRLAAGLTANPTDTQGNFVQAVEISNGRLGITFGNKANASIANETLYLTPYETAGGAVIWRCGSEPAPVDGGGALAPLGASGGGNTASYAPSTVEDRFMPSTCRL